MRLRYYIARRLILMIFVLLGASMMTFLITRVVPSDPARLWVGWRATAEQVEQAREHLGLNEPLYVQYWVYLKALLQGDLGRSLHSRRPVVDDIKDYLPATFELTTIAMLLAILIGIPLGVISASRKDTKADHAIRVFSLTGVSMPVFWFGLMLQLFLASTLRLFPLSGRINPFLHTTNPLHRITGSYILDSILTRNWAVLFSSISHIILPAIALSYSSLVIVTRMTRSAMLEVLGQDYIRSARAKGLSDRMVKYKHALKNALIPTTTVIGLSYGFMLGGSILVETIFDWPGIGLYAVGSTLIIDYPAIMGVTLLFALIYLLVNLVVDIMYALLDPRIRYA